MIDLLVNVRLATQSGLILRHRRRHHHACQETLKPRQTVHARHFAAMIGAWHAI
jgi:hypothetical protein